MDFLGFDWDQDGKVDLFDAMLTYHVMEEVPEEEKAEARERMREDRKRGIYYEDRSYGLTDEDLEDDDIDSMDDADGLDTYDVYDGGSDSYGGYYDDGGDYTKPHEFDVEAAYRADREYERLDAEFEKYFWEGLEG